VAEGSELAVDVRGRPQPVEVVRPPFVPSHVR
jgi:glycine cleavage system T protein (aminomethyltransferase)